MPLNVTALLPNRLETFTRKVSPPSDSRTGWRIDWLLKLCADALAVPGIALVASSIGAVHDAKNALCGGVVTPVPVPDPVPLPEPAPPPVPAPVPPLLALPVEAVV